MTRTGSLPDEWDRVMTRYAAQPAPPKIAVFNCELLAGLRPRWGETVRPDFSMFRILFTRPEETGYSFTERVHVEWQTEGRVEMALLRAVPRRGEDRPVGTVTVTGDFTRPENALPAVEALLYQLADPDQGEKCR